MKKLVWLINFLNRPVSPNTREGFTESFFLLLGTTVIIFLFINQLISQIIFLLGGHITQVNFYLSVLITSIFCYLLSLRFFSRNPAKIAIVILLLIASVFIIFMNISGRIYDVSYDGQAYHQEAIIRLSEGWNPIYKEFSDKELLYSKLLNNYSKGPWLSAASLYKLTNNIEMSKVFNFMLILASFSLTYSIVKTFRWLNGMVTFIVSLLAAFNPVSIYQSLSFYVDGQLSSLLVSLTAVLIGLFCARKGYLWAFFLILPVLICTKLTAIAYVAVIVTCFIAYLFNQRKKLMGWQTLIVFIFSLAVGLFAIGFNPFVTNTITRGNPFYPVLGSGAVDYRSTNVPENFLGMDPRIAMLESIFSKSDTSKGSGKYASLKFPFQVLPGEAEPFKFPDASVAGFGPLFSGAIVLCVLGLVLGLVFKKIISIKYALVAVGILIFSVAINPTSSLARFVPQLWFIPLIIIVMIFSYKNLFSSFLGVILIVLLIGNNLFIADKYFGYNIAATKKVKQQLSELSKGSAGKTIQADFGNHLSTRVKLDSLGVKYQVKNGNLSCLHPANILVDNETAVCI